MKMMDYKVKVSLLAMCMISVTGCASGTSMQSEFGSAVRQVTSAQIYDADAAANPDREAVVGGDPDRLNGALESHRKSSSTQGGVASPITVNVANPEN